MLLILYVYQKHGSHTILQKANFLYIIINVFFSNRKAKSGTTAHGGTMIRVKNEINSEQVKLNLEDNGSVTACLICLCKKKILIVCCYLPPSNSTYAYTNA